MPRAKNKLPKGWDETRVRKVLAHYENQTEEQAVAEDEAAFAQETTVMEVPAALVQQILALVTDHQRRTKVSRRRSA